MLRLFGQVAVRQSVTEVKATMDYMINVDLETRNVSGGATDCQSALHKAYGRHFDLTVHALGCGCRKGVGTHRPPTRYWDDNNGKGYALQEVVNKIQAIQATHPHAYLRRCRRCLKAEPGCWD